MHWLRAHLHCWKKKNRMQNVLFDTADLLPHPPLLCRGSLGFMVRDYSRPQKQLLKPPIKADSRSGWEGRPTVGAQNMQMCRTMEANAQSRTAQPYYPVPSYTSINTSLHSCTYCKNQDQCENKGTLFGQDNLNAKLQKACWEGFYF